jgi:hypothetical protein
MSKHNSFNSMLFHHLLLFISTLSAHRNQQLDGQFKILQLSVEVFTAFYVNIHGYIKRHMEMFVQMCTDIFDGKENLFYIFRILKNKRRWRNSFDKAFVEVDKVFLWLSFEMNFFAESQRIYVNCVGFCLKMDKMVVLVRQNA